MVSIAQDKSTWYPDILLAQSDSFLCWDIFALVSENQHHRWLNKLTTLPTHMDIQFYIDVFDFFHQDNDPYLVPCKCAYAIDHLADTIGQNKDSNHSMVTNHCLSDMTFAHNSNDQAYSGIGYSRGRVILRLGNFDRSA